MKRLLLRCMSSKMALRVISLRCNGSSAFGAKRTWLDLLMARPGHMSKQLGCLVLTLGMKRPEFVEVRPGGAAFDPGADFSPTGQDAPLSALTQIHSLIYRAVRP